MSDIPEAQTVRLKSRKPLAPAFHRHIARGKLLERTCRAGDSVVIYDIIATEPQGEVRVTRATRLDFE